MKIFNRRRINRKGALQLSINAVVILILAITMLGLGLGFIRNLFGGTVSQFEEIAGELDEEQLKSLKASTEEVTFPQRISMGEQRKGVNFAIYNNRGGWLELSLDTDTCDGKSCIRCDDMIGGAGDEDLSTLVKFDTYETIEVDAGNSEVIPLQVIIDPSAPATMYRCVIELNIENAEQSADTGQLYAKKRFEIDYKG
ncbi:MAG: hypothetical protein ACE5FT_05225 [Candidatus Nanoarchaeia archaeon]